MEAHRRFSKYEEQEQVQERTQTRTVGDLFKDHLQTLEAQYERLNNATRSLKENKKRSYERYCEYKETQYDKKDVSEKRRCHRYETKLPNAQN
ncbi:hypothetical protein ACT7DI_25295 [Bacillus paranthracis]